VKTLVFWIDSITPREWESLRDRHLHHHFSNFKKRENKIIKTRPGPVHIWEILTGQTPDKGPFMFDMVASKNSPYKWLLNVGLQNLGSNKFTRQIIFRLARLFYGKRAFPPMQTPFYVLPYISLSESSFVLEDIQKNKKNSRSLTSLSNHLSSKYVYWTQMPKKQIYQTVRENDVTIIHFRFLDGIRHIHGPNSQESENKLIQVITDIDQLLGTFQDQVELVLFFSDHTMSPVEFYFDVSDFVDVCKSEKLKFFINSPVIRYWGESKQAHNLLNSYEEQKIGKIVTSCELKKFNLPNNPAFGENIFWVAEGIHTIPDFYMGKSRPKGMHGYFKWDKVPFEAWSKNAELKRYIKKMGHLNDILGFLEDVTAHK